MSQRSVASRPRGGSRTALRVKRTVAVLVVLGAAAVGADYGAAALTESAVAREMRTQLGLADDPSVRINNFPFLPQAISGRYRSVDVTANHVAVGPLRDVQVRSQLRDVSAPLSQMLGDGPRTCSEAVARELVGPVPPHPGLAATVRALETLVRVDVSARVLDRLLDPVVFGVVAPWPLTHGVPSVWQPLVAWWW